MSCPGNHELKEFIPLRDTFVCDGCKQDAKPTDTLYGCRRCNYDLCESCYDKHKNKHKIKCQKGHELIHTSDRNYKTEEFVCNSCWERFKSGKSHHCQHCDYDLCSKCHEEKTKASLQVAVKGGDDGLSLSESLAALKLLAALSKDEDDEKKEEMSNIAKISFWNKTGSWKSDSIVLTYFHGKNKYYFKAAKTEFNRGAFKKAYRARLYNSKITTGSSYSTPRIANGTEVVLKVRFKDSKGNRCGPIMNRGEWNTDLAELHRLSKYCKEWNKNKYSDKTYEASKAFVLKVSDEGSSGTGQFKKGEYVLIEPFMPQFEKWNWPIGAEEFARAYSVQAFGHFTYHCSGGEEIVNDAQGYRDDNKYIITDPYYISANDARLYIWFLNHECNKFCKSWWKRPKGITQKQLKAKYENNNNSGSKIRATCLPQSSLQQKAFISQASSNSAINRESKKLSNVSEEKGELVYTWKFESNGTNVEKFKKSSKNDVLHSEKFVYDECTFFIECTPNGYSPSGSKEGECTLWLAVDSLPQEIKKLDVTARFVCNEIGYDASRRCPKLGRGDNCSWSMGMLDTTSKAKFMSKSSWIFYCYITMHTKIENPKIKPLELATTTAYNWTFDSDGANTTEFKNSVKNHVLNSEKFVYDGCTFYLECTPNGFSSVGSKEGECTLWLAVESLPDGIGKLDVTVRFVCDEIGYDASRRTPKLGRGIGCSWSVGVLETAKKSQFESKSCWTFKCYITIHEKVIGHGEDAISLEGMMQLFALLSDKDD